MKKLFKKPGFEFIFSTALVAILALPPVLLAQNKVQKDVEIRIENGDTTINGKNIKSLSADDRQSALTDINNLHGALNEGQLRGNNDRDFMFRRRDNGEGPMISGRMRMKRDTLANMNDRRARVMRDNDRKMEFTYRFDDQDRADNRMAMRDMRRHERRNTQNFDYENTNNDGVVTHLTFHVSEASDDDLKRMEYMEGPKFDIKDLNIAPQFSSGKVMLSFSLATKTPADVKLTDSEGKTLWAEKTASGSFSKSFAMGLNGVYYLQVKQGKSIALKRIMKEE